MTDNIQINDNISSTEKAKEEEEETKEAATDNVNNNDTTSEGEADKANEDTAATTGALENDIKKVCCWLV